jgi:hypothetical protein
MVYPVNSIANTLVIRQVGQEPLGVYLLVRKGTPRKGWISSKNAADPVSTGKVRL